ncbi:hypothetical protein JDV02_007105 [Purpureocillium takamizusanense]|uniref:Uncharacterized protein n=1 Tax=Purpureocillium takamizusanense TaxID=2060973 RepID=A0A9Q8QL01_9HYPO|nr:uncharacterized protein JDV02_007105 [Purpureocillium takamizusanense]UNI21086.1 hypothetical protein JDV02_007105 [Purpureocillium takamizusanense]
MRSSTSTLSHEGVEAAPLLPRSPADATSSRLPDTHHVDDRRRGIGSSKQLTLDQLPTEIVEHILSYFQHSLQRGLSLTHLQRLYNPLARDAWNVRQKAVQDVRLVCRRLHDLASPLLFPYVALSIDQESLDKLESISRQPCLAAGVRGVLMDQTCRSGAFVNGHSPLDSFKTEVVRMLQTYATGFYCHTHNVADEDGEEDEEDKARACLGLRNFLVMCKAWGASHDGVPESARPEDVVFDADEMQEYVEIFRRGHEAYARGYVEQFRLVSDGTYLRTLVSAFALMPHLDTLSMGGRRRNPEVDCRYEHRLLADKVELERFIASQICAPADPPENMFVEVPIAAHTAGRPLKRLYVSRPRRGTHTALGTADGGGGREVEDRLRAAIQALESVHLSPNMRDDPAEGAFFDRYASIVTSSRQSRYLGLTGYPFPRSTNHTERISHGRFLLTMADRPRLKKLHLRYTALSQEEVKALCGGLRDGSLQDLFLEYLHLTSGLWADVLDTLRPKLAGGEGGCRARVLRLMGAEMHERAGEGIKAWEARGLAITQRVEWYLTGDPRAPVNPFRCELTRDTYQLQ